MTAERSGGDFYQRVERRIGWLTPVVGAIAALLVWRLISGRAGVGVAIGAGLIWLHYVWLRRVTIALVREAIKHTDAPKSSDSSFILLKLSVGYVLIAIMAYVIVSYFRLPIYSVLCGLLVLGAAAMVGSLYAVLFDNH
ncbi:MAG: ATP synthase subunit I [Candidatus Acidiferrales bacterium]